MPNRRRSPRREHFGRGRLTISRATSVFINCPFDDEFLPLFDAIVFATVCCGFLPRSALESGDAAVPRMDRILSALTESKYSIHDLSRCRGEGEERLARFNMPLELGIAMAQRFAAGADEDRHDWLTLVPEGHQYLRFISDMAGYDLKRHDGTVDSAVRGVMSWPATRVDAVWTPTPRQVISALPAFVREKQRLEREWGAEIPWADVVSSARDVATDSFR